ncbi:MAG: hypothetical protein KKI08_00755 [Armatimonadetes bacterium]|nr:hypothetical protein [Armatimonadota bacterium]
MLIDANPGEAIQAAIDAASNGDAVVVVPGTQLGYIDFRGKAITPRSTNPNDPSVVAATIADGDSKGSVIALQSGERKSVASRAGRKPAPIGRRAMQ